MFGDDLVLDWLDPEPSVENLMEVDTTRSSNARFVTRLDPPLVLPFHEERMIYSNLGLFTPEDMGETTLDGLLFPRKEGEMLLGMRDVFLPGSGAAEGETVAHEYSLHTLKAVGARVLGEVPFAHPRQVAGFLQVGGNIPGFRVWGIY